MGTYTNILVALDTSNEAEIVLKKAIEVASKFGAKITLVHVVEPVVMPTNYELMPPIDIDIEQNLVQRAENFIEQLTKDSNLSDTSSVVTIGSPKQEIHRICKDEEIDLVVIGTHGRHGVSLLLGSTASAVLHGTTCDVLTVKI